MSAGPLDDTSRQWAMFVHLSQLSNFLVPGAGIVLPIVLWQMKKAEMPALDPHGKVVVNWVISALIYAAIGTILSFLLIGLLVLIPLALCALIFPILGGLKARDGLVWPYPLSIKFLK